MDFSLICLLLFVFFSRQLELSLRSRANENKYSEANAFTAHQRTIHPAGGGNGAGGTEEEVNVSVVLIVERPPTSRL